MSFCFRRQPEIPCARNTSIKHSSVSLLPCERMRLITSDRLRLLQISTIRKEGGLLAGDAMGLFVEMPNVVPGFLLAYGEYSSRNPEWPE